MTHKRRVVRPSVDLKRDVAVNGGFVTGFQSAGRMIRARVARSIAANDGRVLHRAAQNAGLGGRRTGRRRQDDGLGGVPDGRDGHDRVGDGTKQKCQSEDRRP